MAYGLGDDICELEEELKKSKKEQERLKELLELLLNNPTHSGVIKAVKLAIR